MKLSVQAGRLGYLAGRMDKKYYASAKFSIELYQ
jgi:thiazole synthase ThiGH ThiG subunit